MKRNELRALARDKRRAISAMQAIEMSLRVAHQVVALPEFLNAQRVMCYASMPEEVQTQTLHNAITQCGKTLCLPAVRADERMEAVVISGDTEFHTDSMGIRTPLNGEVMAPEKLDLVIAPGLAFDKNGTRLGHGKGYYDKFLSACDCPVIGLSYDVQMVDHIVPHDHDVPMDKIVTETAVYDCRAKREQMEE